MRMCWIVITSHLRQSESDRNAIWISKWTDSNWSTRLWFLGPVWDYLQSCSSEYFTEIKTDYIPNLYFFCVNKPYPNNLQRKRWKHGWVFSLFHKIWTKIVSSASVLKLFHSTEKHKVFVRSVQRIAFQHQIKYFLCVFNFIWGINGKRKIFIYQNSHKFLIEKRNFNFVLSFQFSVILVSTKINENRTILKAGIVGWGKDENEWIRMVISSQWISNIFSYIEFAVDNKIFSLCSLIHFFFV